jgi:hypothetical protein
MSVTVPVVINGVEVPMVFGDDALAAIAAARRPHRSRRRSSPSPKRPSCCAVSASGSTTW